MMNKKLIWIKKKKNKKPYDRFLCREQRNIFCLNKKKKMKMIVYIFKNL